MKINVERGAFLKALSHVQSVVERRNTIPILSNVMMEAGKGALKLTATDLDIEIVESIPADILRNGSATAPAHMLHDIVRKLPDGAQVQVELLTSEGGRLAVSAGHSRFELACLPKMAMSAFRRRAGARDLCLGAFQKVAPERRPRQLRRGLSSRLLGHTEDLNA